MDLETCPKCGVRFPAAEAWANRDSVLRLLYTVIASLDTRVRCPSCGFVFPATEVRYFGFLSPRGMKILFGVLVLYALVGGLYFLFLEP
jgi:uncharacterized C2H2 Zn-finger protein